MRRAGWRDSYRKWRANSGRPTTIQHQPDVNSCVLLRMVGDLMAYAVSNGAEAVEAAGTEPAIWC